MAMIPDATRLDDARPAAPRDLGRARLAAGGALFLLLTLGVFWFQFNRIATAAAAPGWRQLQWGYLA